MLIKVIFRGQNTYLFVRSFYFDSFSRLRLNCNCSICHHPCEPKGSIHTAVDKMNRLRTNPYKKYRHISYAIFCSLHISAVQCLQNRTTRSILGFT